MWYKCKKYLLIFQKNDLIVACERHYTSKLKTFDDLREISTFGFRGEALASISCCSRLTITSKTRDSECAYKAEYHNGCLKNNTPPKGCAGVEGTTIRAEDLFYNNSTRKNAINVKDEHKKMFNIVAKYAINNPGVSISFKKHGETTPQIATSKKNSTVDIIKKIYSNHVSNKLMSISLISEKFEYDLSGYISNIEYSNKSSQFILFINKRLVENKKLKKEIQQIYSPYIGKSEHPFIYLNIKMLPKNLEVNVHPTKQIVHWLHEDEICEEITEFIKSKLLESSGTKVFITNKTNTKNTSLDTSLNSTLEISKDNSINTSISKDSGPKQTTPVIRKVEQYGDMEKYISNEPKPKIMKKSKENENLDNLETIKALISECKKDSHEGVRKIIKEHIYVGFINPVLSLIQHNDKLFVVNAHKLSEALFYQMILSKFSNLRKINIKNPLDIETLVLAASKDEEMTKRAKKLFGQDRIIGLMNEYYSIEIKDGCIKSLPQILDNHVPPFHRLPDFLLEITKLSDDIWKDEMECLFTISKELAKFYSLSKPHEIDESDDNCHSQNSLTKGYTIEKLKYIIQHYIFPACKIYLDYPPSAFMSDGTIIEIANLSNLFKIFERC